MDIDAGSAGHTGEHGIEPVSRVRRIIGEVELDCRCKVTLDDALDRYAVLELARQRGSALRGARGARATIGALVDLLAELDEVSDVESDRSVFGEFALMFESIAEEATAAAAGMRRLEAL